MSIYETRDNARESNDVEAFIDTIHEDFVFVSHQDGTTKSKAEFAEMARFFLTSDDFNVRSGRCLFENSEVMVEHSFIDFPDGTTEAVLGFHQIKDGKVIRTETGATLIEK